MFQLVIFVIFFPIYFMRMVWNCTIGGADTPAGRKADDMRADVGAKIDAVGLKIHAMNTDVGTRVDAVGTRVDAVGTRVDAVGTKIDAMSCEIGKKLDATNQYLKSLLNEFVGHKKNVAQGIEKEVLRAVELYMYQRGFEMDGKPIPRKRIRDDDNVVLAEVDGLIYFKRGNERMAAIVEAKTRGEKKVLNQVSHAAEVLKAQESLYDVIIFVGSPLLPAASKDLLLRRNIVVLEPSGAGFHAVEGGGGGVVVPLLAKSRPPSYVNF